MKSWQEHLRRVGLMDARRAARDNADKLRWVLDEATSWHRPHAQVEMDLADTEAILRRIEDQLSDGK